MPSPAVLLPDIETEAVAYLGPALAARPEPFTSGVRVATKYTGSGRQVVPRRDGGPRIGVIERPRLAVNVWAPNDEDANDLARMVAALVMAWPGTVPVTWARQLSGPSVIDDPNASRRYLLFELTVRGTNL